MQNDPAAGQSAIRSFFLNITELIVAPLAIVSSAMAVIAQLGHDPAFDLTGSAAWAVSTLLLFAVLEIERRRCQAGAGVAMTFQRLHLYGVQLILLIVLTFSWNNTAFQLGDAFVFNGLVTGTMACGGFTGCPNTNMLTLVLSTLWLVAFWIGYGFFSRNDTASLLRSILHFASFAYGVGLILYGISRAIELGILSLFQINLPASEILNNYNFVALSTLGLLITLVYALWLRITASRELSEQGIVITYLIGEAIVTALFAIAFWVGVSLVFFNLLQMLTGITTGPRDWAPAIALIITGLAYIPFDFNLHQRYKHDAAVATEPRRGFVFAMLAAGILSTAIGAAIALYSLGTYLLGSPFENWQQVARAGTSACVVGIIVLAWYFWTARREHLFSGLAKRSVIGEEQALPGTKLESEPVEPPPSLPDEMLSSIDAVLDDLLAGKISRDEAAMHIQGLMNKEEIHSSDIPGTK